MKCLVHHAKAITLAFDLVHYIIYTYSFRDPSSMTAAFTVLVDELLWGETHGFRVVDHSKPPSHPDRVFWQKLILLFWVGDYPGLGKCANMKHSGFYGCHWCKGYFYTHSRGHNVQIHNRRRLRTNHLFRKDSRWGAHETRSAPPLRTTEEVKRQSQKISQMEKSQARFKLKQSTGIDGFCLLLMVSMFDIVWDMLPDMMHITKGLYIRKTVHSSCLLRYIVHYM
jgi:hypothetical protein